MTNLQPSAADKKKLAKLLDEGEFGSALEMAEAALELAFQAYEDRSRFIIVGQLRYSTERGFVRDNGDRVAFGPFGSLTPAREAFTQLTYSAATNEEFKAWLVPYEQGTPAQWFLRRKKIRELQEDVPLTNAEKLIVRYNPDQCHRWGLTREGGRTHAAQATGDRSAA